MTQNTNMTPFRSSPARRSLDLQPTIVGSSKRMTHLLALFTSVGTYTTLVAASASNEQKSTPSSSSQAKQTALEDCSGLPKYQSFSVTDMVPAMTRLLDQLETDFKNFETQIAKGSIPISYENVIDTLDKLQYPTSFAWGTIQHLNGVKNSEEIRKVIQEIQPRVVKITTEIGQSRIIYDALKKIQDTPKIWSSLDRPQQRIVESSLRSMQLSGVALVGDDQKRFSQIKQESAKLATKFNDNALDGTKKFKILLKEKSEVEGIPPSTLLQAAQKAKQDGFSEATGENGPWQFSLDLPTYLAVMQHAKNRKLREQMYRGYVTKASDGPIDNRPLIQEMLKLKKESSKLLGFKTFAERSLSKKMAKNVAAVDDLIEVLRKNSYEAAQNELKQVRSYAASKGETEELQLWDITYWSERQKEELYDYEAEKFRPYFPFDKVAEGLFGLAKKLFNVDITKVNLKDEGIEVWDPHVQFFKVTDLATGRHIANFYVDPFTRPSEKRSGAWHGGCITRNDLLGKKPVSILVCNGTPPVGDTPSLMTFDEVRTLFHEFGHGLQHMLTNVKYGGASGYNNIEWDAVEIPSQFMENWIFHWPTFSSFARHYKTGEPFPRDTFEKISGLKKYQAGMQTLRQLYFGRLDMDLHHHYNPDDFPSLTAFDIQKKVAARYTVLPPLPDDAFLCGFLHIFGGGYDAGYYSYKWAEVRSADAFGVFEEAGLENSAKMAETGLRFRNTILGMGGGEDPAEVYRKFSGREPTVAALLRHCGLGGKAGTVHQKSNL